MRPDRQCESLREAMYVEQSQRSRTLEIPAIMRALHQSIDSDPKILDDPIAPLLLDPDDDRQWLAPVLNHPFAKQIRAGFVLRSRYAEDCLAEAVRHGVQQYLIFGPGLDTWLTRLHPDQFKSRLRALGFSAATHLTPEETRERYFKNRRDGLRARLGEQLMRAVV
ncbi:MAG: class I SAM-dependent methyltransferase [Candidatus Binatus sp.]